ncbi:MAG: ParA family protein [Photobacterium halotolerans]
MKVIAISNKKGGVGKTTTTVNLADAIAHHFNKRVLIIDMDPQGNSSLHALGHEDTPDTTIAEIMANPRSMTLDAGIAPTIAENVFIIPADYRLEETDDNFVGKRNRSTFLSGLLSKMESQFDFVLIDCAPGRSIMYENAVMVAGHFLVPVEPDDFSMQGVGSMLADVVEILDDEIKVPLNIFINKLDNRLTATQKTHKALLSEVPQYYTGELNIRTSSNTRAAVAERKTVRQFNPKLEINNDYYRMAKHLVEG